jgi:hypothetical protein
MTNAVRATEVGVIHGVDQQKLGKVERIDVNLVNRLIESGIVPLVSPVAFTRDGACLRISSDLLAAELSLALGASKIIYLCPSPGILVDGKFVTNVPETELSKILDSRPESIASEVLGKVRHAVRTVQGGTPRAHIIDGRIYEGLLTEIFSKVGIGSMIYRNEYEEIRPARKKDAASIYNITRGGVRDESLRQRTRTEIEQDIEQSYTRLTPVSSGAFACVLSKNPVGSNSRPSMSNRPIRERESEKSSSSFPASIPEIADLPICLRSLPNPTDFSGAHVPSRTAPPTTFPKSGARNSRKADGIQKSSSAPSPSPRRSKAERHSLSSGTGPPFLEGRKRQLSDISCPDLYETGILGRPPEQVAIAREILVVEQELFEAGTRDI